MRLHEQHVRGVTVIHGAGDFVATDAPCALQAAVKTALARGQCYIVLNLAEIGRMDSLCLGDIVASFTSTVSRGGGLNIVAPAGHVRRLLELARLETVIKVF